MNPLEVFSEINKIFKIIFKDDSIVISEDTSAKDIDDWDSLSNIEIIISVGKKFGIRFKSSEIRGWSNVGEMCKAICLLKND